MDELSTRILSNIHFSLGTCAGFQHMVIEFARNVLGLYRADSEENDTECEDAVMGMKRVPTKNG